MTRYAMIADLNRCVGCQTCTAACKHANATAPGVQWRKVLDFEVGQFPEVSRAFVPVGCMHCDDPPCLDVCPSTATRKRADGIVTIDYDICIGCAYCAVACPYQARFRVDSENAAFGKDSMSHEITSEHWDRRGVAQKCTFCLDRVEPGLANGFKPGIDPEATPVCVNSCIADALHFGDVEDPESNVSVMLAENASFRMHEELDTKPRFYYLWESGTEDTTDAGAPPISASTVGLGSVSPKLQKSWDWRAAANFIGGGTGTGLFAASALASFSVRGMWPASFIAMFFVAIGLFCVWMEIGRPLRFMNVLRHAKLSWMTREAFAALPFFGMGLLVLFFPHPVLWVMGAAFGMVFLYCQGRILQASKGIPAWRQKGIVPLIMATGLTEGAGLLAALSALGGFAANEVSAGALLVLLIIRFTLWRNYRSALGRAGAPVETFTALDKGVVNLSLASQSVIAALVLIGLFVPFVLFFGGLLALVTGWAFKFTLVTRAAFNQGYAVNRMPARGDGPSAVGIKPGWTTS